MPYREGPAISLGAIQRYNETLLKTLGADAGLRDLDALAAGIPKAELRAWLGDFSPLESPCWEDTRPLSSVDWFPILENRDLSALPEIALPAGMEDRQRLSGEKGRLLQEVVIAVAGAAADRQRRGQEPQGAALRHHPPAGEGNLRQGGEI